MVANVDAAERFAEMCLCAESKLRHFCPIAFGRRDRREYQPAVGERAALPGTHRIDIALMYRILM